MKIQKIWNGWKNSCITFVTRKCELDLMSHPTEWSTPYFNISFSKCTWMICVGFLCFSGMLSYTKENYYKEYKDLTEK